MNIYFRPTSRFGHDFIFEQRGGCEKASPRNDQLARQNENQKSYILHETSFARSFLVVLFPLPVSKKLSGTNTKERPLILISAYIREASICTYIHPVSSICFSSAICPCQMRKNNLSGTYI